MSVVALMEINDLNSPAEIRFVQEKKETPRGYRFISFFQFILNFPSYLVVSNYPSKNAFPLWILTSYAVLGKVQGEFMCRSALRMDSHKVMEPEHSLGFSQSSN